MENKDNLLGVVRTVYKWRRPIAIVCLIALAGSVLITLMLPNYYKSSTLFLAASPDQSQPELLFGRGPFAPQYYGNANDIDRLLTIGESDELVRHLIDSFDLYDHYRIDPAGARVPFKVRQTFFDLYTISKTKRDAIELSVEDRDRELAARIANAAREKIDAIAQRLIKENQLEVIRSYEMTLDSKQRQLTALSDSLIRLRQTYGIYNSDAQSESLTDQYQQADAKLIRNRTRLEALRTTPGVRRDTINALEALVKGQLEEVNSLVQKIELLNQGMAPVNILYKQYLEANQSLGQDIERYKLLTAAYASQIPATILIEQAAVPVVKSRPRRSIIVLAATAIAFLFSLTGVLLLDTYKAVNWREIVDAE